MDIEDLVVKIEEDSELSKDEIQDRIKNKEQEFSGLISREGAAHIVAKEAGVDLLDEVNKTINLEDLVPGMNSVNVQAKVTNITDIRTFERDDGEGRVVNVNLADETGDARMSLWDEQVDMVEDDDLKEGMTIEIANGYTKEDNMGNAELRVGKHGMIKKSDEELDIDTRSTSSGDAERITIGDVRLGETVELRGAFIRAFDNKPFFYVCPECDETLSEGECPEHGSVTPQPVLIMSGILDDGTGNIRAVFFRDAAEKVLGMGTEEIYEDTDEGKDRGPVSEQVEDRLGKEFIIRGFIKENDYFEQPEIVVNDVEEVDPTEEARKISGITE